MSIRSTGVGSNFTLVAKLNTMHRIDRCPKIDSTKEKPEDKSGASHIPDKPMEPDVLRIINHKYPNLL